MTEDFQRAHIESLESDLREQKAIVSRIREMFGNPDYPFVEGKTIYDLIQDGIDAIQLLSRYREHHCQPSGQQCYVDLEKGDHRCADCIEADRLTGVERVMRKMSENRIRCLRESLARPNNLL